MWNWLKWWRGERPLTPAELASITEAIENGPQGVVAENPANLSRRGFLKLIAPAAAGLVLAPTLLEELLAPQRTYFMPPVQAGLGLTNVEEIVRRQLAEEAAAIVDANVWSVNSLGGYLYSRELSKVLRQSVQPMLSFRQFADVAA